MLNEKLAKQIQRHLIDHGYVITNHAHGRATERRIYLSLVVSRIRARRFEVIEAQYPNKFLLYLGEFEPGMPPVHTTVALDEKLIIINVQWCDYNIFEDDGKTRRRRSR